MQREMRRLLMSPVLKKATSSSRLLSFLVESALHGVPNALSEYAIGIAVFGRDAASYRTGEDPIVRVQIGRLRTKLAQFYATDAGQNSGARLEIPFGSYIPRLVGFVAAPWRLAFHGLDCIAHVPSTGIFARGLSEELRFRLHCQFAGQLALVATDQHGAEPLRRLGVGFLLEGSVRDDGGTLRTAFRLLELADGRIAWSERADHGCDRSLARQEQLAATCCSALSNFFGPTDGTSVLR